MRGYQVVARWLGSLSRADMWAATAAAIVGVWAVVVGVVGDPTISGLMFAVAGFAFGGLRVALDRRARRAARAAERAARDAELAARADRQHQLYMRDPAAYLRRIEKGETP